MSSQLNIDFGTVTRLLNFAINVAGLIQDRKLYHDEATLQRDLFNKSREKAEELHKKSLQLNKQSYLVDLYVSLEQHFQQLNADLVGSSKESQRDMFDQRNQQLQTIILSSSVMFSALSTIIIQGPLNTETSSFLVICYSLTCSLSFASLFITIVICMEVVMRASRFMLKGSQLETANLRKAIANTGNAIRQLRHKAFDDNILSNNVSSREHNPLNLSTTLRRETTDESTKSNKSDFTLMKEIARMEDTEIEEQWVKHEHVVEKFLRTQENIIDEAANVKLAGIPTSGSSKVPGVRKLFDDFWEDSCKVWADFATSMFYFGTVTMLLAVMIFMWSTFDYTYGSIASSILAVLVLAIALVVGVSLGIILRKPFNRRTDRHQPLELNRTTTNGDDNEVC